MSEEFRSFTSRVTKGEDGVWRWYYDMDMYRNKSMLYMLEKVNLLIFIGVAVGGSLLIGAVERDFGAPMIKGILLISLGMCALMALLYWFGFYIAAAIMKGKYRIHLAMRESGIEIVWSDRLKKGYSTGKNLMSLTGSVIGSRRVRGRWRPTLEEVSAIAFSEVIRCRSYPKWDMIDLSVPGGKFQVYVGKNDFESVKEYILERVPVRVREASR